MSPSYDLNKIKYATDAPTYRRAVDLYKSGKVTCFVAEGGGYSAVVLGGSPYHVYISDRYYDHGNCDCYLGMDDTLCKHMVAVAIRAVLGGAPLSENDEHPDVIPVGSGRLGLLDKTQLAETKGAITAAMRLIKPYNGPSRIWFRYQSSLQEGCGRLSEIVSALPVSEQTADLLVNMLLRLDKKLCVGGVDDSDGTVGGFMQQVVMVLETYAKRDPTCIRAFRALKGRETCFEWEQPLLALME